jgi:hypothetical protein
LVACTDPGVSCTARNSANMTASMSDSPTNPATRGDHPNGGLNGGGPSASSGDALVNATPTPTPSPRIGSDASANAQAHQDGRGSTSSSRRRIREIQYSSQTVAADLIATGHIVLVDLWDQWPNRRLPPMPTQPTHTAPSSTVDVSLNGWPGVDELPLPELGSAATPDDETRQSALPARPALRKAVAAPSLPDVPTESDDGGPLNVLAVFDVDPFGMWPSVEALPLPAQVVAAGAVPEAQAAVAEGATPSAASDDGIPPQTLAAGALVGLVLAGIGASRRGRTAVFTLRRRLVVVGLTLLRLTVGILRLW